jgi:hypothetical protein
MFTVSKGLQYVVLSGLIILLPFILGGGPTFDMYKLIPTIWNGTVTFYQWYMWICFYPIILLYHIFKEYFIEMLNYYFGIVICLGVLLLNKLALSWMYQKEEPVENIRVMLTQVFGHLIKSDTERYPLDLTQKEAHLNQAIIICSIFLGTTILYWNSIRYLGYLQLWYVNPTALRFGFGGFFGLSLATLSSAGGFVNRESNGADKLLRNGGSSHSVVATADSSKGFQLFVPDAISRNYEDIMCIGVTSFVVYLIPAIEHIHMSGW